MEILYHFNCECPGVLAAREPAVAHRAARVGLLLGISKNAYSRRIDGLPNGGDSSASSPGRRYLLVFGASRR